MSDVALYFPYVNLPGDEWVKAAALHWPQLGRIRPHGYYGLRDSDTVRRLREELDFVIDVRPGWGTRSWVDDDVERGRPADTGNAIELSFFTFLARHRDELTPRYGTEALGVESLDTEHVYDELLPLDPRLEKVHPGKMSRRLAHRLAHRLAEFGLLISRSYRWRRPSDGRVLYVGELAMHRRLALAPVRRSRTVGSCPVVPVGVSGSATWTAEALPVPHNASGVQVTLVSQGWVRREHKRGSSTVP